MAKKKTNECDWKGCRKRKGVEYIAIEIFDCFEYDVADSDGFLCPHHREAMLNRLAFRDIA